MAGILKEAELLVAFAEQADEADMLAMDGLVNFLRREQMPPKGSIQAWTERPYLVHAVLLTAGIQFDGQVGARYVRMEQAVEKYKTEHSDWWRYERRLDPRDPGRTVYVRPQSARLRPRAS